MPIDIKNRYNDRVLKTVDADTLRGADLGGADLGGADLRGADLGGADLRGAYLGGAYLGGADLRGAYLRGADLRGADLRGADLRGADLRGADLRGAIFAEAKMNWDSHDLIAEMLLRSAGGDIEKRKIAGLILISRDWCWGTWLALEHPLSGWALDTLAGYVVDGDGAPAHLRARAKVVKDSAALGSEAAHAG